MKNQNESVIGSFYTPSACIDKVPDMKPDDWATHNPQQAKFLEIYKNCAGAKIPELESIASIGDVAPVNAFLRQRNFDLSLGPIGPRDIAIASVLDVILKWLSKGKKTSIKHLQDHYKAVDLVAGVEIRFVGGFNKPVAIIECKNGDYVYMTVPDAEPKDAFDAFSLARKLTTSSTTPPGTNFEDRVIFPMIDLDIKPSLSWLIGLSDKQREKWAVAEAMQQTKVKMNEEGVIIRDAVAMSMRCASFEITHPLVIDEPFLFAVKRQGLKEPLFSAYLNLDGWLKSPSLPTNIRGSST